jgi:hypothetical protein
VWFVTLLLIISLPIESKNVYRLPRGEKDEFLYIGIHFKVRNFTIIPLPQNQTHVVILSIFSSES